MRQKRMYITLVSAFTCLFLCMSPSCGRKDTPVVPGVAQEPIFNADGGFVITQSMLDQPYNRITFPGTHNSFAGPGWHDACGNQDISIMEQLFYGIRYIELDVDYEFCASHNGYCTQPLLPLLDDIVEYASTHPSQIITIRISDLSCDRRHDMYCGYCSNPMDACDKYCPANLPPCTPEPMGGMQCCHPTAPPEIFYANINWFLETRSLTDRIYNWNSSISDNGDPAKCYVPYPWPTLGEMIRSGKNIMFFHHRDTHDIVDSGYFRGLDFTDYSNAIYHDIYKSFQLADLSRIQPVWEPGFCDRQKEGYGRLFLLECNALYFKHCDNTVFQVKTDCPGRQRATNDGRRHYQLAKQHEEDVFLLPGDRIVNFIAVDYYRSNQHFYGGYKEPIDVVDACNRLNYERFGLDWSSSYYTWEVEPHEFDQSKIEYVRQIPALRQEVNSATSDFKAMEGLEGHETHGAIVSTAVSTQWSDSEKGAPTDWLWLPEWAVDDDYYTGWRGEDWGGSLGIDLGSAKPINEIAIAWKYTHMAPGYTVYVSDALAGDFIDALNSTDGWTQVAQTTVRSLLGYPQAWDRVTFDQNSWRYIKIVLPQGQGQLGSAIFELRVFGPSD